MVLEIDNILRSDEDIRKALLSLRAKDITDKAKWQIMILENMTSDIEFKTRALEYDLNNA